MPISGAPALLLAAGGGGFTDLNLGVTVWTLVLFGLFALVLWKFGWGPLLQLMEERENEVRSSVEGAEKARTEAQALLAQHQELLKDGMRQREEIVKKAIADAEQLRADLSAKARAESEALLQRAKEQIEREKRLAVQELRDTVADLAVEAAGKIVQSSLTPEAQKKLVNEFVAGLPKA
jgi:F-type H+-transporting ATPase subunit b